MAARFLERLRRHPDRLAAAALAILTFALRWPDRSRYIYGWDSVLFALALEDYDVEASTPHPPGYPLWVALGRLLFFVTREANSAYVFLSLLFAAASVAGLYLLLTQVAGRRAGLVAALLFLTAPLLAYHSVVALSYTFEAAASVTLALLAWRTRETRTRSNGILLGLAWALAVGVRQSLLFYMAPLIVWALLPWHGTWRDMARRGAPTIIASVLGALAWFVPMVLATGYGAYRRASEIQSEGVVFAFTIFSGGLDALRFHWWMFLGMISGERLLLLLTFVALLVAFASRRGPPRSWWRRRAVFFGAWILPTLAFHLLVFNGLGSYARGYGLTFLPALYGMFAIAGDAAMRGVVRATNPRLVAVIGTLVLLTPAIGLVPDAQQQIRNEVRGHDEWADGWNALPLTFPPNETAILAHYGWAHAKWYFPEYVLWSYFLPVPLDANWTLTLQTQHHIDDVKFYVAHREGPFRDQHPIPPNIRRVILFDFQLAGENGEPRRIDDNVTIHDARLENGWRVLYFDVDPSRPTIESYFKDWPWWVPAR